MKENYYLVKFEYSDFDIDVNGFALLTNKDKEFFENIPKDNFYLAESISGNSEIEFKDYYIWRSCYHWKSISKEEYKDIERLIGSKCGYFFYPEIE